MGKIYVGVGGWTYEPWRGVFFPKGLSHKDELAHASRHLTSIEINGTFYRTQNPTTFAKWRDETPDEFVFSVKAHRLTTNRRVLAEAGDSIQHFFNSGVKELKEKLGAINWQFAGTKKFDPVDFEAFLQLLPPEAKHAVEVRHESFKCEEFVDLARKYRVAIVLAGDSEHPLIPDATAPFVYARIMGTQEGHEAGYPSEALETWSGRAIEYASGGVPADLPSVSSKAAEMADRDVFLYVISGFKQANPTAAVEIIKRVSG